ncbi:hypothetical protein LJB84_01790, partial [Bacteroidales bacterium OttesenSCG-928-J19]|nr:hypothetical protein [Bacteroidales bacterium OttesenSCG-928-J19]
MIYIYHSDDINLRRLEYVATHLFKNILEVDFALTSDKVSFLQQSGPCINYSREDLRQGLWIVPQGLLSESGVNRTTEPHLSRWDDLFCFF